ncbi:hypothetical protein [Hamadaea tsunoensis]|uniref:hypothetical protein n=1 Tax=Hamadaea tsunoensis TaxID=53368 RepID=UPI000554AFD3|nr:hypothetical protein [Hamadaea tsunoensis]
MENGFRIVAVVTMSEQDVEGGQRYEDLVLDLLPGFDSRVERRLRTPDGRTEVQELWFPSRDVMAAVMVHPARLAARDALGVNAPTTEVYEVDEVPRR